MIKKKREWTMVHTGNDWDGLLLEEFEKDYYKKLREFLKTEYAKGPVYPSMYDLFNALVYTPYAATRVVILGQDPYHGAGQAHGLCFSVRKGTNPPPSLQNIYKELEEEYGRKMPAAYELTGWAKQGVLLLNTTLSVRGGQPLSHRGQGWEILTDRIISLLDQREEPIVFLLWGAPARAKHALIKNPRHLVLECAHPSPLSAYHGFFGCGHFKKANAFLAANGEPQIDWFCPEA